MAKKSTRRVLTRMFTFVLVLAGIWFAWEWRQQAPKEETLGVQTDPKKELLVRCLDKAQTDYDRNMRDTRSAPEPQLAEIAAENFEKEKAICQDLHG